MAYLDQRPTDLRRLASVLLAVTTVTLTLMSVIIAVLILAAPFAWTIRVLYPSSPYNPTPPHTLVAWAYHFSYTTRNAVEPPSEYRAAQSDDELINSWIARCTSDLLSDQNIRAQIKLRLGANAYIDPADALTEEAAMPISRDLKFISDLIARGREENAERATAAYVLLQSTTWAAILLGLATTVFVSLGSTEFGKGDSKISKSIRVLSIIFPALGTAAAALAAFYAPREDLARSSQALASFRQIHDQIASEIGSLKCPGSLDEVGAGGDLADKLAAWKKSLKDARSVAEAAALAAVDPTRTNNERDSNGGDARPSGAAQKK